MGDCGTHDTITHILPVKTTHWLEDYVKKHNKEVERIYGVPLSIISNKGAQFTMNLLERLGFKGELSTVFPPHTYGQVKRTINTLEDMLIVRVSDFKCNWDDHLPHWIYLQQ